MLANVLARARRAVDLSHHLVETGAVDAGLVWSLPRLALAAQLVVPPLDEVEYDYAEFVDGAAHAYETLNELVYRRQTPEDEAMLAATCTPQIARILARTAEELHGPDRELTYALEQSRLNRRSLNACVADVFATERERELEHTLRGYDDVLHDLDEGARVARIGAIAEELAELQKERASKEAEGARPTVVSAEFDVLFESHEKMSVEAAGQTLVVEKKQLSTWRFLSRGLDEPEWRVCKIF